MSKIEKPAPKAVAAGPRGRFVGLEATGPERYQVVLLETVGGAIVKREVLSAGKLDMVHGRPVTGSSLPVALHALDAAIHRRVREATDLWRGTL
jgi:hypothetical protein